jgi:hypothetical protein
LVSSLIFCFFGFVPVFVVSLIPLTFLYFEKIR